MVNQFANINKLFNDFNDQENFIVLGFDPENSFRGFNIFNIKEKTQFYNFWIYIYLN